jgi:hypothetical protein
MLKSYGTSLSFMPISKAEAEPERSANRRAEQRSN